MLFGLCFMFPPFLLGYIEPALMRLKLDPPDLFAIMWTILQESHQHPSEVVLHLAKPCYAPSSYGSA